MCNFGRHADALAQRGVRVDGLANVDLVGAHLDGQGHFTDQIAGMGADDATADDAVRLGVEQQLGDALVPPVGDRATRSVYYDTGSFL